MKIFIYFIYFIFCFLLSGLAIGQTIELGTGTATTGKKICSPINIWYRRTVCQFVYTASEIQAQGITVASFLTEMGFDVRQSPIYNLPGYTIKLKHTTATNVANDLGFSDWTKVKSAFTYAPISGGYDMLTFDTPFYWDGVSNIGVEICWDRVNPKRNASGKIRYYTTASGYRFNKTNAPGSSCGGATTNVTSKKPKCQMVWISPYTTVWTGANTTDWFNTSNWTAGVPVKSIDTEIPGGLSKYPVINADGAVAKNITIYSGSMLTVLGGKGLSVYGDWTNNGDFIANIGTVHFNKLWTGPNQLNGNVQDFYSIQVNNSSGITFSSGSYNIYGALIARGGILTTNNLVTLASNATKTGRIPEIKTPCIWTLDMMDSQGNGWNGGYLSIFEDGVFIGSFAASGSASTESFEVFSGSTLTMSYTAGSWEAENTYTLKDPSGNTVNSGGPNISDGTTLYTGTSNCAVANPFVGDITAQRYLNIATDEWRELSTPIANQTLSNWQDDGLIMAGFPGSNFPNFGWMSVYSYNETLANGIKENGWVPATNISNSLNPASTHRVYVGTGIFTMEVAGTINFGDINYSLSYENNLPSEISADENQKGWNLIGNPYPCTVDWDNIPVGDKPNIDDALWVWSGDLGNYGLYVGGSGGTGTNDVTNEIASSQGFWVHANATGASLTLKETDKIDTDPIFVKNFSADDFVHIKLTSDQNSYRDEILLKFDPNGSINYNSNQDYSKFYSHLANAPSLAIVANDSVDLTVKSVPLSDEIIIPIKTLAGVTGNYTLSFSNLVSDDLGCIILEDKALNTYTPITDSSVYTFFLSDTTLLSRFNLKITPAPVVEIIPVSCNGFSDGAINISFFGDGPFQYNWHNINQSSLLNTVSINQISAGIHNLYIYSSNPLCTSGNISVNIPEPLSLIVDVEEVNPTCSECDNGSITILPSGGTSPYTIYLDGMLFDSDTTLEAGTYSFEVNDANGCSYSFISTLEDQPIELTPLELNETKIYPSPANNELYIKSTKFKNAIIHDIRGVKIYETKFDGSCVIPTNDLSNGIYILYLGKDTFKKIVVQH